MSLDRVSTTYHRVHDKRKKTEIKGVGADHDFKNYVADS